MGSQKSAIRICGSKVAPGAVIALSMGSLFCSLAFALPQNLEHVRDEITRLETDLVESSSHNIQASQQLKKIRKLIALQKQEIVLANHRMQDLTKNLNELSQKKESLEKAITLQRVKLRRNLKFLAHESLNPTPPPTLEFLWVRHLEDENERAYYLKKLAKKNAGELKQLNIQISQVGQLELKITEEKAKMEYYVQELTEKNGLLASNEKIQQEILKTNRGSQLEQLTKLRALKDTERELRHMLSSRNSVYSREAMSATSSALMALKGRLPYPVSGSIVSAFGRTYDSKTSLLTFQKGVSISGFPGSDVKAVAAGKIVYAGELKNYGLMVIVEHPGQFYTLYGQLGKNLVHENDVVKQSQSIGQVSAVGTPVYFEIRDRNIAINPLQWFQSVTVSLNNR